MSASDIETLRSVLALADEYGLTLGAVKVGEISLQVLGRLPRSAPEAPPPGTIEETDDPARQQKLKLEELRRRSKIQFGYVKPDSVLLALDGVL